MTTGDQYRVKAGDFAALARAESDPFAKAEYEKLSLAYLRLADQADRNSEIDVVYATPLAAQQQQAQQQQQVQPQQKRQHKK